jgi:hypothetical protein
MKHCSLLAIDMRTPGHELLRDCGSEEYVVLAHVAAKSIVVAEPLTLPATLAPQHDV